MAGALRENAGKHGVTLDYMGSRQAASWWLLLHTIGCDSIEQEVAFNTLADLIDPTWQARRQTPSGGSSARQMTTTTGGAHMATEAQIRAQKRYDAANTRQVHLKLNLRTDKDVIEKLDNVPNMQGYIKKLIRADLEK